ncbi:Neuroendocrine convertase 1 [Actinoplanes sp. SE50]|uniref:S8 family serine peptidase n=1 Tax=unclassified Actinoplanes TaxID=2626549 RepID=UPI00023EC87B|nr:MULTISPECIES: S8 family serine peptidase [unclassified Actinoplanes]AEV87635.1 Neuroendocrine convertase 1 [Actinoplanes sp. SE50/110]ATO86038.1 Neuroendocrine convertase 1 [Actinoplanes sp. SE50]SLM03452.1 Neuroendocrine convertase 1 [Actinoplanes sp. SE50/110]
MTVGAVAAVVVGIAAPGANAQGPDDVTSRAFAQISALQQLKKSMTAAERKLDSRLAVELRQRSGRVATSELPRVDTRIAVTKGGTTEVEVHADRVDAALLGRLRAAGAGIRYPSAKDRSVLVEAPLGVVTTIAGWSDVTAVTAARGLTTGHETDPRRTAPEPSKEARAAGVEAAVKAAESVRPLAVDPRGSVVSEGDRTHAADTARTRFKISGVGVKVCALSDGVDSLAASQATGDLPADVDVLTGQDGSGDEGTAMLEIIHDLVPNARLGFATAFTSEVSFADNIRALRFTAGCDIIVDDVVYYHESPFQDGAPARAVNDVIADGAFYFSSAGNEGNKLDGTAGNWEGDFADSGRGIGKFAGRAHDFDPGPGVQVFNPLSPNSTRCVTTLWWADPLGGSANDYDLYLLDAAGNVTDFSQDVQDGNDDPFEALATGTGTNQRLAVVKFSGADRYLQLSVFRGRFADTPYGTLKGFSTPGALRGHAASAGAFAVAAAPAHDALPFDLEDGDPPNPAGPYPNVFTRQTEPERFTSDGPRRIFYNPDGTAITPGDFSSTGGLVRTKPEITAADGVLTSMSGFAPFYGTSAAAPHAAAIAALALSGNPGLSNAEIRAALTGTALDLAPAGVDNRTGFGVLRADLLLRDTGATPQPLVKTGTPTVTPITGDGDAYLEPGEQATVAVPAVNVGDGTATGVSVVVGADDPRATVTPHAASYGTIAAGATKAKNYKLTLAADYPLGRPVTLTTKVTFAGTLSPTTGRLVVPTGQPGTSVRDFAYTGAPVPIPDNDPTGVTATVDVSGVGYASALTFSIDGTACSTDAGSPTVGLDHTFVGDLIGTLTAPDGRAATLFSRSGAGGNNLCQVVFDDSATVAFTDAESANAPFTGTWRPDGSLSSLRLSPVDGTWSFHVADRAGSDTGSVRAFSLHLTGFAPA